MISQGEMEVVEDMTRRTAVHLRICSTIFGFVPCFTLSAACQLRIFDIVEAGDASSTLTTEEIAAHLPSKTVATQQLYRLLRMLASMGYLTATASTLESGEKETRFGRTPLSAALLMDVDDSLAGFLLMETDELFQRPWHYLSDCILTGKSPADHAFGTDIFTFAGENPKLNAMFQKAMSSSTHISIQWILRYEGFRNIKKLVDVGGGIGKLSSKIVAAHPHIQAVNFDLPHVVALAPQYPGVEHIAGSMFEHVPSGDAVFLKNILHDWGDEACVKILKNVHKALPEKGRVLICDLVLDDKNNSYDTTFGLSIDMLMVSHTSTGMERSREQWQKLLECTGFTSINIIPLAIACLIEAFKS